MVNKAPGDCTVKGFTKKNSGKRKQKISYHRIFFYEEMKK